MSYLENILPVLKNIENLRDVKYIQNNFYATFNFKGFLNGIICEKIQTLLYNRISLVQFDYIIELADDITLEKTQENQFYGLKSRYSSISINNLKQITHKMMHILTKNKYYKKLNKQKTVYTPRIEKTTFDFNDILYLKKIMDDKPEIFDRNINYLKTSDNIGTSAFFYEVLVTNEIDKLLNLKKTSNDNSFDVVYNKKNGNINFEITISQQSKDKIKQLNKKLPNINKNDQNILISTNIFCDNYDYVFHLSFDENLKVKKDYQYKILKRTLNEIIIKDKMLFLFNYVKNLFI